MLLPPSYERKVLKGKSSYQYVYIVLRDLVRSVVRTMSHLRLRHVSLISQHVLPHVVRLLQLHMAESLHLRVHTQPQNRGVLAVIHTLGRTNYIHWMTKPNDRPKTLLTAKTNWHFHFFPSFEPIYLYIYMYITKFSPMGEKNSKFQI